MSYYAELLLKEREEFYAKNIGEKTWMEIDVDDYKKLEAIDTMIIHTLYEHCDYYSVDYILDILTKIGMAPNLLYDDNGNWAIVDDGIQSLVTDNDDEKQQYDFIFCVEKTNFSSTIREALKNYLWDSVNDVTTNT